MSATRILILEDDSELRALLVRGLREEGYAVDGAGTGARFLQKAATAEPDVMIVDIGLPDADGRDVCQALRSRGVGAPVLFLSARGALTDRLSGFSAGGDDYLTKPFAFAELLVRVEALVRRAAPPGSAPAQCLRLDPAAHTASCADVSVRLSPTEFRLLAKLAAAPGEAVRRRTLVETAWPHGAIVHDNTLDVYVARLRRRLVTLPGAPGIHTVHGVGYSLR